MPTGRPLYKPDPITEMEQLRNRVEALERRRAVTGHYAIKLFADTDTVTTGDGVFLFSIPYDLDESKLRYVGTYVTTVSSSGLVTVQIHNVGSTQDPAGFDMLTTRITIDANEKDSETAATPWEIQDDYGNEYPYPFQDNHVFYRQQLRIDVDAAGTGAKGLGIHLGFE